MLYLWNGLLIQKITKLLTVAVWSREELIEAFMPVWQKIYFQEPEAILFRLPVDPVALGVPVSDCITNVNVIVVFVNKRHNCEPTPVSNFRSFIFSWFLNDFMIGSVRSQYPYFRL